MSDQLSSGQEQDGPTSLPMNVLAQYVKDLSFENPNAPQSLMPNQSQPQVNIGVDVQVRLAGDEIYEVVLQLRCEAKQGEAMTFLVELAYAGLFQLPGLPQEHHRPVLMIEAPRMLFPFARAIVSEATRDGGFPPLMINPIDFADLYRRQMAAAQVQGETGEPPQGQSTH
jgi:preprotein translocase subunit SecB